MAENDFTFEHATDSPADIPPGLIESELAIIERSESFRLSRRHQQLLRHLVEHAVAGNTGALKEPVLAFEVFARGIDTFDPVRDTIVRVEARRLRQRLARYYGGEGSRAALEIRLPVGSYVPTVRRRAAAGDGDTATLRATDLVERGEHFLRQPLGCDTLEEARKRFEAALREKPQHAPALVGLGRAWFNLAAGWYHDPRPASDYAAEALRAALALDPSNAPAHALLGTILHQYEFDWPAARASLRRAVQLAPEQAFVHSAYGYNLIGRRELEAADRELSLARRLDPQYVNARMHMVNLRIAQGRLDHAESELDALRDIAPDSMPAVGMAGLIALLRGDGAEALRQYERVCELAPENPNAHASLAAAQGFAGRLDLADATLALVRARFGSRRMSPYVLAIVATRCGRIDQAFMHLDEALAVRDPNVMWAGADPSFEPLRGDRRWPEFLARRVPAATA